MHFGDIAELSPFTTTGTGNAIYLFKEVENFK